MRELLRADFRRVLKDKLLIVMGILAVVFALITPLLYTLLFATEELASDPMLAGLVSAKSQFFQSFSLGNNLGLIAPVLLAIVLCKDFSYGTVRNKIISGKSRHHIFLSLFTVCSVTLIGVMLLNAAITLGVSLFFFEYQPEPFEAGDLLYFAVSLLFEILVLLFISALLSWLCAAMKNVGLVIVLYVAIAFILVMVGSIIQVLLQVLALTDGNETLIDILSFIDRINIGAAATYIGAGTEYSWKDALYLTLPSLCGTAAFLGLGFRKFARKDLK